MNDEFAVQMLPTNKQLTSQTKENNTEAQQREVS
jgi:hypothetical protein